MKISVALAAYKGEKYIEEQLRSILVQLNKNDEIIISDDCPAETMRDIVRNFDDERIKYVEGPKKGVVKNFEHAINLCEGDIIFLCDQDDVWAPDKVEKCVKELENGNVLVMHDAKIVDENLKQKEESFFKAHKSKTGIINNIIRNSYIGCCMSFKSELKRYILPFPEKIPMHDQWIGMMAEKHGRVSMLNEALISYRRHEMTVTGKKTSLSEKIKWRYQIIRALILSSTED